jgi:hypothetical protein
MAVSDESEYSCNGRASCAPIATDAGTFLPGGVGDDSKRLLIPIPELHIPLHVCCMIWSNEKNCVSHFVLAPGSSVEHM